MAATFRTTRLVEFGDTDMAGIVHFARFFEYMEAAEHALLRSLGLSVVMDWEGEPISFPRVSASCDYFRPARFEDLLTIAHQWLVAGRTFAGLVYAHQLSISIGKAIGDLELIAKVFDPPDMINRIEFIPY